MTWNKDMNTSALINYLLTVYGVAVIKSLKSNSQIFREKMPVTKYGRLPIGSLSMAIKFVDFKICSGLKFVAFFNFAVFSI